ncbi:MAG: sodium:proton antiporter [Proteobacteria bacterium]|nr:sodium:proton antiporter [Pseudomonadota bacterium]MBU1389677.1 sodium:proton antiporter [Pseudomonadota bacterium]MBU1542615.1 sodium:proton antiporter [Pseudomonadota bacterium]MBU2430867.1 sodium:proton antiporter [Pseudomonadota bacterium]MBU2481572.1 sodium:proton antiporter [Pseudomonadota bacterium]
MMTGETFLSVAVQAAMGMLLVGMVMVLFRLAKGPGAADRVIAMDLLSVLVVAFLVVLSIHTRKTSYMDVAIAYACIAFLGTIALVRFIHRASVQKQLRQKQKTPARPLPDHSGEKNHD